MGHHTHIIAATKDNKNELDYAVMSASPGQTNTAYPTTQMTTEDNDDMVSYTNDEEHRL